MTYYVSLSTETDEIGRHYIKKVYRNTPSDGTEVKFLASTSSIIPAYERLISVINPKSWVWADNTIKPSFAKLKEEKIKKIESIHAADLLRGITIGGITLAASEQDQNTFSRYLTMLSNAEALMSLEDAAAFQNSQQTIADIHGSPVLMTVAAVRGLIVNYGYEIQQKWLFYGEKKVAVVNAQTLEQLNAII